MRRTSILVLALVTVGLAGCIGPGGGLTESQSTNVHCEQGSRQKAQSGSVSPSESLTVEATIDGDDAGGEIYVAGSGAGEFEAVFAHEDEEIDRITYEGAAIDIRPSRGQSGLPAGTFTLEVTSDVGSFDLEAGVDLSWSEGCTG